MADSALLFRIKKVRRCLSRDTVEYDLRRYDEQLKEIMTWSEFFASQSETKLHISADELKIKARSIETLDALLPQTFGLVYEIIRRLLSLTPFREQLIAAMVMHQGKIAQMQTGEGKTLAAVFPACLHAFSGKGTHILTFNDYLARRDAAWMGPVYEFLGLSVGVVQDGMCRSERQRAYASDITYLTAKESGFDYLRDSLVLEEEEIVHRALHYAIVDEADSILIDEARIPLIIAASSDQYFEDLRTMAGLAGNIRSAGEFAFDDYARNVYLTERGLKQAEEFLECPNLYADSNLDLLTKLNCALHAEFLLNKDKDYIVRNGCIELVDEFTGRIAGQRRWHDGLQAAIEAKENVIPQSQGRILNSITLQHFLRKYPGLAGMTATAAPAAEEFREFYGLDIVVIPPHTPCIRRDLPDRLFKTKAAKNHALVEEIKEIHARRQPVLVGTGSVAESMELAEALQSSGITCHVLNARHDEDEAEIIAKAGRLGAVTISTNMAGRGTDIRLGYGDDAEREQVARLGGLHVIGANKHESARIDDQLRGRAGRQGDPGSSRYFISLEDDLFIKYKLEDLLPSNFHASLSDGAIVDRAASARISQLQRIVESQNLEIRKTLFVYSDVLEHLRQLLFQKRTLWLTTDSCLELFQCHSRQFLEKLTAAVGKENVLKAARKIMIMSLDQAWSQYLAEIADLREGIHFTRFEALGLMGGPEPVVVFQKQAIAMFEHLESEIEAQALDAFHAITVEDGIIKLDQSVLKAPSSTWTYLINDDPFDLKSLASLEGKIDIAVAKPLLKLISWIRKSGKRAAGNRNENRT